MITMQINCVILFSTIYYPTYITLQRYIVSVCPAILTATPNDDNPFMLHVNLPSELQHPLILRTTTLDFLQTEFDSGHFQCVVCTGECINEDDVIFRLSAQLITNAAGVLNRVKCTGDMVRK